MQKYKRLYFTVNDMLSVPLDELKAKGYKPILDFIEFNKETASAKTSENTAVRASGCNTIKGGNLNNSTINQDGNVGTQNTNHTISENSEKHGKDHSGTSLRQKTNLKFERNKNFTGREKYLGQIEKTMQSKNNTLITQAITGLGGIGKTQLVVEYVYTNHYHYDLIWWFEADTVDSIRQEYIILAQKLGITLQDKDQELQSTLEYLEGGRQKWLLVFDNADNIDPKGLKRLLPKVTESGHIIITSRQKDWHGMNCEKISLDLWPEEEAKTYLLKATPERQKAKTDEAQALELCGLLGYLPLVKLQCICIKLCGLPP